MIIYLSHIYLNFSKNYIVKCKLFISNRVYEHALVPILERLYKDIVSFKTKINLGFIINNVITSVSLSHARTSSWKRVLYFLAFHRK